MSALITPESYTASRAKPVVQQFVSNETDDEIIERMRMQFDVLEEMTRAVKKGDVKGLIISGSPGVGKTFGIERVLRKHDIFTDLGGVGKSYDIIKGNMSALMLYRKLFDFRNKDNVLVLDDVDNLLVDEVALNILKTALDTGAVREISWNTDSRYLKDEGVPTRFEFEGSVIFITNIKFASVRSKKLQDHLAALESRCHYFDLNIDTVREKLLRIKQIVNDGMLNDMGLDEVSVDEVMTFIDTNQIHMRELSLRTLNKICELRKFSPRSWQSIAKITLMKKH
jgi:hypothetical protein